MVNNHPHLEVIVGPMFSGKTTELLRRLTRAQIAGMSTLLIRPKIDHTDLTHDRVDQYDHWTIRTANMGDWPQEKRHAGYEAQVIGIDEVQFFPNNFETILALAREKVVIVAGLDTTFAFQPWSIVGNLMALAEKVDKLTAVCVKCGNEATRTQRLINGKAARLTDPVVLVGDEDFYEARCSQCWEISP